jgi:hypothetical protein
MPTPLDEPAVDGAVEPRFGERQAGESAAFALPALAETAE